MSNETNYLNSLAADDFNRARNRETLSRIQHFLKPDRDKLLSFHDVKEILKPKNEVYRGMQSVSINRIVGSEGRYQDFNRYFLPRSEFLRARWEKVDKAKITDIPLPAIQIYEIGGVYFVRDGNHRVSVARANGGEEIDAEVTSLATEIQITPDMTVDDLRAAVINYEKKIFYDKTRFGTLTGDNKLNFTHTGQYDVIYNHILVHKYYLNQDRSGELPFAEALVSWYNNVYRPIIEIIDEEMLCINFPGRSPGDLYVWIVKHWDYLKKQNGVHYSVADAARDFSEKYGDSKGKFFRFLAALIKRFFKKS